MAQAAKVLATIHAGTGTVTDLPEKTGLLTAQILAALGWLSQIGLVELEDQQGSLRVRITEAAKAALSSA